MVHAAAAAPLAGVDEQAPAPTSWRAAALPRFSAAQLEGPWLRFPCADMRQLGDMPWANGLRAAAAADGEQASSSTSWRAAISHATSAAAASSTSWRAADTHATSPYSPPTSDVDDQDTAGLKSWL
eukprot:14643811-Heterocapsa_arctica.AAC.1